MGDRIVVGVDGSQHAARALAYAVEEARRRDGAAVEAVMAYQLTAGYPLMEYGAIAIPPETLEKAAGEVLDEAVRGLPADAAVETRVLDGSPGRVLVELSRDADLVVVGSRGYGGFRSLLLGSTSHQVVSHAHCPVVVVPAADRAEDG